MGSLASLTRAVARSQKEISQTSTDVVAIAWQPRENTPQEEAFYSDADEIFFGGIAGAGKSDLLLGLALTQHKKSIVFRRQYPQLAALIDRSKEIVGSSDRYNEQKKRWTLGDRIIEFGAVQYEKDWEKFQGRPHDLMGFDEITHFSQSQYLSLTGWKRTVDENQRTRIVCTGNPPTTSQGRWVIEYWGAWLDPNYEKKTGRKKAKPCEVRYYIRDGKGESVEVDDATPVEIKLPSGDVKLVTPRSRTFIPGKMIPDLVKTGYAETLASLPEPMRSALLLGKFDLDLEGQDPWAIIPKEWVRIAQSRWRKGVSYPLTHIGVDVARGGKDETVIALRHAYWISELITFPGSETPSGDSVADQVCSVHRNYAEIRVDVVGVGSSVFDSLARRVRQIQFLNKRHRVYGLSGGKKSDRKDKSGLLGFANKRAEWWWHLRELLDPSAEIGIAIPDDPDLFDQLTMPRWYTKQVGGKDVIAVESKEDLAKEDRLGCSPDKADAIAYAFAESDSSSSDWILKI